MGNRAVIAFNDSPNSVGVYVHWNGGRDSVEGFLDACRKLGFRDPSIDQSYAMAGLITVIKAYLTGETGCGVNTLNNLDCDNYDNGLYIVGKGWKITGRKYAPKTEQTNESATREISESIVKAINGLNAAC